MMQLGRFFQIAFLILLAAGAQPAYSAFWQWSKTAALNAGADPTINFAEGMSPSSVNDSARALMARAAEWRDDISGTLATAGTSTAYTLATNEAAGGNAIPSPPSPGQMLAFIAHTANGVSATLAVDGGTAYPLHAAAGTALPAGTIQFGGVYRASFNLSSLVWVLEGNYSNPYGVPLGSFIASTLPSPPNANFVSPAGQCISTTTYAAYWVALGSPPSTGCAGGQFAVVDLRGRVPAGLDTMLGLAAGRMTNSVNGCGVAFNTMGVVCGGESQGLNTAQLPVTTPTVASAGATFSLTAEAPERDWVTGGGGSPVPAQLSNGSNAGSDQGILGLSITGSITPVISMNSFGSGTPHPNVQPTIGVWYYLRVL